MPRGNEGLVGKRVLRNFKFLYRLHSTRSPKKRWDMVQNATNDQLLAIMDITKNLFLRTFRLTKKQERKLLGHDKVMRKINRARSKKGVLKAIQVGEGVVIAKDNRVRIQRGGGAPFLTSLIAPVLIEAALTIGKKMFNQQPE